MAGFYIHASESANITVGTTRTILQIIAPSDQKIRIRSATFTIKGDGSADPAVICSVVRQTGAGTSVSATLQKRNEMDTETIRSTALKTFSSTEPTTDKTYAARGAGGHSGVYVFNPFTTHSEGLIINEGERVAFTVQVDAGASGAPDITVDVDFEE